ncbi:MULTISPECIES: hypothetical protein [unclassified Bradyrhizobium]|uniref:hypothetical protein n=1 Tax=unclassified Bradyrhizobium TaxID=2631580 RepID=UPI0028F079C8|nr:MULTISPECIES: hypothetical protein [unclassified Bradyrhizobium]
MTLIDTALQSQSIWDFTNTILYNLCRDHPEHKQVDVIISKLMIVGRVYAAQLERRRNAGEESTDTFYVKVAEGLIRSDIDEWLRSLRTANKPTTDLTLVVHRRLLDLFKSLTGMENRSFASKYLHFHCPGLFFIYDTRARRVAREPVKEPRRRGSAVRTDIDADYAAFCRQCTSLTGSLRELLGHTPTPRELDKILLYLEERNRSPAIAAAFSGDHN